MRISEEKLKEHIEINLKDGGYSAAVVATAMFKYIFGEFPKIGLSGFQAEAATQVYDTLNKTMGSMGELRQKAWQYDQSLLAVTEPQRD